MADNKYMKMAIDLALKGVGWVNPNPLVGAVIVKDGRIIGQGYHAKCGALHAERAALAGCTEDTTGADMYVTLEPCCHHGKQPPCTDAIIEADIRHVIIGSSDPNPMVAGKGCAILREKGIKVTEAFLKEECDAINPVFFHYIKTRRPYVVMKYAMTMDGHIATVTGASRWITGEKARQRVHEDRHRYMGIMVGIGTVLKDDPLLNCRIAGGKSPVRIICDTNLRIPLDSQLVRTAGEYQTIIATCCDDAKKLQHLEAAGCQVLRIKKTVHGHPNGSLPGSSLSEISGSIDLNELMNVLGEKSIDSILLEGGGQLNWSALRSGIVNKVQAYMAPKIFGGTNAPSPVAGHGVKTPNQAFILGPPHITCLGDDILIESEVISCSQE